MIEELKYAIDLAEGKPKAKELLLKIASLPEEKQKPMLDLTLLLTNILSKEKP